MFGRKPQTKKVRATKIRINYAKHLENLAMEANTKIFEEKRAPDVLYPSNNVKATELPVDIVAESAPSVVVETPAQPISGEVAAIEVAGTARPPLEITTEVVDIPEPTQKTRTRVRKKVKKVSKESKTPEEKLEDEEV